MLWDDGNTAGDWLSPFPMLIGWVLLGAASIVAVALLALFAARVIWPNDDGPEA